MTSSEINQVAIDTLDLYKEIMEAISDMESTPILFDDELPDVKEKLRQIMNNFVDVSKELFHFSYEVEQSIRNLKK